MCAEAPPGISANQWYRGAFDSDMFCLLKPREPTVRELRPKGLIPELLRGQSLAALFCAMLSGCPFLRGLPLCPMRLGSAFCGSRRARLGVGEPNVRRMAHGAWSWRLRGGACTPGLCRRFPACARLSGRPRRLSPFRARGCGPRRRGR